MADERQRSRRKARVGTVVSDKMDKTVVVKVATLVQHPLYKKTIRRTRKLKAHDAEGEAKVGDRVEIVETRPLAKTKCWRVSRVIEKAVQI
jgi:small subunit ribosomal protein S17